MIEKLEEHKTTSLLESLPHFYVGMRPSVPVHPEKSAPPPSVFPRIVLYWLPLLYDSWKCRTH